MDDRLQSFLAKFAELERRVRKLAAEDRSMRDEVKTLRQRLMQSEAETVSLRSQLARREQTQAEAKKRLNELIERLNRLQTDGDEPAAVEAVRNEL